MRINHEGHKGHEEIQDLKDEGIASLRSQERVLCLIFRVSFVSFVIVFLPLAGVTNGRS